MELPAQLIPKIVVGPDPGLVHLAEIRRSLEDGLGIGGIVVRSLAPGAARGHIAVEAFRGALRGHVQRQERSEPVPVDPVKTIAEHQGRSVLKGKTHEPDAGVEISQVIDGQHLPGSAPVHVVSVRLAEALRKKRAGIAFVELFFDDLVRQAHELFLESFIVPGLPDVLEHDVDIDLFDAQFPEVQDAFPDKGDVAARDGDFRRGIRELFKPAGDVPDDVIIGTLAVRIDPLQIVFRPRAVDGDLDAQMGLVLRDVPLHSVIVIQESVRREAESIAVEPGVILFEGPGFEIVADAIDQVDLDERFPADEIQDDRVFCDELPFPEQIIDRPLGDVELESAGLVLSDEIAVFAAKLAVFRDDKSDAF